MVEFRGRLPRTEFKLESPLAIRVSEYLIYKSVKRRILRSLSQCNSGSPVMTRQQSHESATRVNTENSSEGSRKRMFSRRIGKTTPEGLNNRLRTKTIQQSSPIRYRRTPASSEAPVSNCQMVRSEYFMIKDHRQRNENNTILKQRAIQSYYNELMQRKQKKYGAPDKVVPTQEIRSAIGRRVSTKRKKQVCDQPLNLTESPTCDQIQTQLQTPKSVIHKEVQTVISSPISSTPTAEKSKIVEEQPSAEQPPTTKQYKSRRSTKREPLMSRRRITSSSIYTTLGATPLTVPVPFNEQMV